MTGYGEKVRFPTSIFPAWRWWAVLNRLRGRVLMCTAQINAGGIFCTQGIRESWKGELYHVSDIHEFRHSGTKIQRKVKVVVKRRYFGLRDGNN